MLIYTSTPSSVRPDQLGEADADSLGTASLGIELPTGANVSVPVDVPLPLDEHAARAAPIAKINTIRFSMNDLLGIDDARCAPPAGPSWGPNDRSGRDASVVRSRARVGVACGSQSTVWAGTRRDRHPR